VGDPIRVLRIGPQVRASKRCEPAQNTLNRKTYMNPIRNVLFKLAVLAIVLNPTLLTTAQTHILVLVESGRDDLRGGNSAFINLVLCDGTLLTEQRLSNGLDGDTTSKVSITFPETVPEIRIRSVRIRHDGNPRSGHPFDTYDNWDLKRLRVRLADASFVAVSRLYDSARDPLFHGKAVRFTGDHRQADFVARTCGSEPDFVIERVLQVPRGVQVMVKNVGEASGRVVRVNVQGFGNVVRADIDRGGDVPAGGQVLLPTVAFSGRGTVRFWVEGVDGSGSPETLTGNNLFTSPL